MATLNATNTPQLTTNGQLIIGKTGANPVASTLTAGTNVTITNGSGSITIAQAAGGSGALTLIATSTASNSASINFDNQLSATYDNYMVVVENLVGATSAAYLEAQIGTTATPTYQATNYLGTDFDFTSSGGAGRGTVTTAHQLQSSSNTPSSSANNAGSVVFYLFGVNSSLNKSAQGFATYVYSGSNIAVAQYYGGQWQTTTVLTSVKFFMSSGNISTGTFKLYGISN